VKNQADVVSQARLHNEWPVGDSSVLGVSLAVQAEDVKRYQAAILRFWDLEGNFWAPRSAFR
jgi:hypothetical protein